MEIKRKVVSGFRKNFDIKRKNLSWSSAAVGGDKWNSDKSTCSSKGKVTVREYLKYAEDSRFKPKNMILCLTIRKIILSKIERLKKYSFSLLRCLYKEFKIISSPIKKKKVFRSISSIKHTYKQSYLKKSQETLIIEIFKRNKNKSTINKLFFIWNKELHRKLEKRKQSGIHFVHKLKVLTSKVLKKSIISIKKSSSSIIDLQKFLLATRSILKKKVFRELFARKNFQYKIEVKQFAIHLAPSGVLPILISKNPDKNPRNLSKTSVKKIGEFKKGLWILSSCKGFCRPLLRKGFRKLRDHARKIRLSIQVGVVKILFQFFSDRQVSDKKMIFKLIALYAKKRFAFKVLSKSLQKSANILSRFLNVHKTKAKIFAFTKIFLQFSYTQKLRNFRQGFDRISNTLKAKLMNRLYYGMINIQTYMPIREIYKINVQKSPWVIENLQRFRKSYQRSLKKDAFAELFAKVVQEKLEDFCLVLDSIVSNQKFKKKLEILTGIKQIFNDYQKKRFLNCMKFNFMLKKVYMKKIAHAFVNWENKTSLSRVWNDSIASVERSSIGSFKTVKRRTNSIYVSTCESRKCINSSRKYSHSNRSVTILPRPKNIHDYIDDFVEILRDSKDFDYFMKIQSHQYN